MNDTLRVALIGAGTICRSAHVPCLMRLGVDITCVVDPNKQALLSLKSTLPANVEYVDSPDVLDVSLNSNCAIVCSPTAIHFQQVHRLLESNLHVLCEKPLACTGAEAQQLADWASERRRILQVGYYRRFHPTSRAIRSLLRNGELGQPEGCIVRAGHILGDAPASLLNKSFSGGGVLMDFGVHVIDRLYSWFDDLKLLRYRDDSRGGLEVNAVIDLEGTIGTTVIPVTVVLSWTNDLGYESTVDFDGASLVVPLNTGYEIRVVSPYPVKFLNQSCHLSHSLQLAAPRKPIDYFCDQWQEFTDRVNGGTEQLSSLADAVRTSSIVEACYGARDRLELSWGM